MKKRSVVIGAFSLAIILVVIAWVFAAHVPKKEAQLEKNHPAFVVKEIHEAFVVLLNIRATDNLPFQLSTKAEPTLSDEVNVVGKPDPVLYVSGKVVKAIAERKADYSLKVANGLVKLEDIGAVLIENITFAGEGRRDNETRIYFSRKLVGFPKHSYPDSFVLRVLDSLSELNEIIPMPKDVTWHITKDGQLKLISGVLGKTLRAGEIYHFNPLEEKISIKMSKFKPVKKGNIEEALKAYVVQEDLGNTLFSSDVSIQFYGKLPLVEIGK